MGSVANLKRTGRSGGKKVFSGEGTCLSIGRKVAGQRFYGKKLLCLS